MNLALTAWGKVECQTKANCQKCQFHAANLPNGQQKDRTLLYTYWTSDNFNLKFDLLRLALYFETIRGLLQRDNFLVPR